jgi:hypothetical protein
MADLNMFEQKTKSEGCFITNLPIYGAQQNVVIHELRIFGLKFRTNFEECCDTG